MMMQQQKKIREEVDDDIDKCADLSYMKKNFRSKLDDVKQDHKELKNVKVVAHYKLFYVCCQEKQKPTQETYKSTKICALSSF